MPKLTNEEIDDVDGQKTIWDTGHAQAVTGFGCRILTPTKRTFFINYRDAGGKERRHSFGSYPTWSATAARAEAKELRKLIDQGKNPAVDKRDERNAPTVQELIDRYIEDHLPKKAQGRREKDERRMLAEIGKSLKLDTKVKDVHSGDIQKLHDTITREPTKRNPHGRPVRANRVLAIASKMFSLALLPRAGEKKAWRDASLGNPCKGIERNHEEGRERFFSEAELAALGDVLKTYASGASPAADAIRLSMLTGCRPGEALLAKWEQFDTIGFWIKPSAHIKQRKKHQLPLSPAAIEFIERIRKQRSKPRGADWVFPGAKASEPVKDPWECWGVVRERATVLLWAASPDRDIAKLVADLRTGFGREPTAAECLAEAERRDVELPKGLLDARIYDLRHSYASIGAARGMSLLVLGKLLGHTVSRTTEKYAHLGDDPLRKAATEIASTIANAGKTTTNMRGIRGA
jgi:integrase